MQETHRHTRTHSVSTSVIQTNMCTETTSSVPDNTQVWQKDTTFPLMWIKRLIGSEKSTVEHSSVRLKITIYL